MKKIISIVIVFIGFIGIVYFFFNLNKSEVVLFVDPNDSLVRVLRKMKKKNIIKSIFFSKVIIQIRYGKMLIMPGKYFIKPYDNLFKIIKKINQRDSEIQKIVIPEGLTVYQVIKILENTNGIFGKITKDFQEGELFPDTYFFKYGDNIDIVVNNMHNNFKKIINELWQIKDESNVIKTKREAIILASLVEKESKYDDERAEIAGVFVNRLKKRIKLQADPTVIYAITQGRFDLNRMLTRKDTLSKLPHNTYYFYGLPPTPIANPGKKSIIAAIKPNKTLNMYFVANKNGRHIFSKTLLEHNSAVASINKARVSTK